MAKDDMMKGIEIMPKLHGEARAEQLIREAEEKEFERMEKERQLARWEKEQQELDDRYQEALASRKPQERTITWDPYHFGEYEFRLNKTYLITFDDVFTDAAKVGHSGELETLHHGQVNLTRVNAVAVMPRRFETPEEVIEAYVEANSGH